MGFYMKKLTTKSLLALFGLIMFANFAMAQTVIFQDDFESGTLSNWTLVDNDGDGNHWFGHYGTSIAVPHSGSYVACSWSWNEGIPYTPDNWMISPEVTGAASIKYYVSVNQTYPDHYAVLASTTGNAVDDFILIFEETVPVTKQGAEDVRVASSLNNTRAAIPWLERNIELPEGTKYVAFRHYDSDNKNFIVIDDVSIMTAGANMNRWIELTVEQGQQINIDLKADKEVTDVRVVSGNYDTTFIISTGWNGAVNFYADVSIMNIYGNVSEFNCSSNNANITGLDVTNNTGLKSLYCRENNIAYLDLSGQANLLELYCYSNNISAITFSGCNSLKYIECYEYNISSLDLTNFSALEYIDCYSNNISNIEFTGCNNLMYIDCSENNLSSLDVSWLTALEDLYCISNNISTININGCDSLNFIFCFGNNLSACAIDSILYQLPIIQGEYMGKIYIKNGTFATNPGALTCRDTLATNRNWKVWDFNYDDDNPIIIENTTYECPDFSVIEEISASSINIYPNPASNNLNVECEERINNLELYDAIGRMLIRKTNVLDNTSIDVSNLESGMYILKIRTENGSGEYKIIIE